MYILMRGRERVTERAGLTFPVFKQTINKLTLFWDSSLFKGRSMSPKKTKRSQREKYMSGKRETKTEKPKATIRDRERQRGQGVWTGRRMQGRPR